MGERPALEVVEEEEAGGEEGGEGGNCTCVRALACACVHACLLACVRACVRACLRESVWFRVCVCLCVRMRACVRVHLYSGVEAKGVHSQTLRMNAEYHARVGARVCAHYA